jgi:hypothetical protein
MRYFKPLKVLNMKSLYSFLLVFLLFACGSQDASAPDAKTEADSRATGGHSCLADLVEGNEIEKMISAEQIAELAGVLSPEVEVEPNKSSTAQYSTIKYSWEPEEERTFTLEMKVGDRTISQSGPLKNSVDVGMIEIIEAVGDRSPLEIFDLTYGPKTQAQKEKDKAAVDRAQESSDQVDESSAEVIKAMVDKFKTTKVEDTGTRAYGSVQKASGMVYYNLYVLHENTMFEVTTDVSDDTEEDARMAKLVAQRIVANCE